MINLNQASNDTEIPNKGNINISNIEQGVDVHLYQIALIEYVSSQPKEGYKWNETIQTWIDENFPEYSNSEDFYKQTQTNDEKSRDFYDHLTAAIKTNTITISPYLTKTSTGTSSYPVTDKTLTGQVEFSEVEAGTYLIIIENGYMVYSPSVVNLVPTYNQTTNQWEMQNKDAIIKATVPTITKTVTDENTQVDNYSTIDTITYTIQADIPKYLENSLAKKYYISDILDKSLTINEESLTILGLKQGNEPESITGYQITFNTTRPESSEKVSFLIDFDYEKISAYESIKITYTAKLNKNSIIGTEGNNNYACLDYSNNPYDETSIQKQNTNKVTVYTYSIEIKSVDQENIEAPLPGSEFSLTDSNGNKLYFIKENDGIYYLTNKEDEGATSNLQVDEQGQLYIYGLDEGIYTIEQTKAPEGYKISSKKYEIELIDNEPDGILDEEYSLIFPNTKGFLLPTTGGIGTTFLICVGILFICTGLIYILKNKKKNNK